MSIVQIILLVAGFILMVGSGSLGHVMSRNRATPRVFGPGVRKIALPQTNITVLDVTYAFVMIIGVLAKEVWDNINETGTLTIKWPRLIGALLISPIIYASVYSKFVVNQLSLFGLAIAFQNGFFWQAVFRTAQGGK